jgi:hypothetical protein
LEETSMVANQIMESLSKPESPWTLNVIDLACGPEVLLDKY